MHIYGDTLVKYVTRELPPEQLATLDTHISNCMFCAHALAAESAARTTWERRGLLGRLVRVEPRISAEHPPEEVEARAA